MKKKIRQVAELATRVGGDGGADRDLLDRFRRRYDDLAPDERLELYRWMATELEVGRGGIEAPIRKVQAAAEDDRVAWNTHVRELRKAVASPRQRLLEALINTTGGMEFVLEMRAEILDAQREGQVITELAVGDPDA